MSLDHWESAVLAAPGAEVRIAEIQSELRANLVARALIGRRDVDTGETKDETT